MRIYYKKGNMETSYLIILEDDKSLMSESVNQVTGHPDFHKIEYDQVSSKMHRLTTFDTLDGQSLFIFCWAN